MSQKRKHDQVKRLLEYVEGRTPDGSPTPPTCRLCGCTLVRSDEDILIHVLGKRHLQKFNERQLNDERLVSVPPY